MVTDVFAWRNRLSMTNPLDVTWNYEYDSNNNVSKVTDPLGKESEFAYDTMANLTQLTRRSGHSIGFTYDAATRASEAMSHPLADPLPRAKEARVSRCAQRLAGRKEGIRLKM